MAAVQALLTAFSKTTTPADSCDTINNVGGGDEARRLLQKEFSEELPARVRARLLDSLPTHEEIAELNDALASQSYMHYQDFLKSSQLVGPPLQNRFFLASVFDKFAKNQDGLIDVEDFLKFVQRSVDVERVQLDLAAYASPGSGSITEQELERFVLASIPRTPLVAGFSPPLHADFLPFFVFTAVRRFFFFLDPQRTRSLSIHKLAHSQEMDEFLWLQRLDQYRDDYEDEEAFQEQVAGNWFSAQNAIKLYDQYVRLDEDGDGMLSQAELLAYHGSPRGSGGGGSGGVQLTPAVIARIFQENITYQPAMMDYKTFLDLALALECRDHMQSLRYFWRVIDLRKDGLLHPSTVDFFFRDIRRMLLERGYDSCPQAVDVRTEVMDMLGEEVAAGERHMNGSHCLGPVSFKRMVESGQASTVIAMLIDIHKFWAYDNRESLGSTGGGEEGEEGRGEGSLLPDSGGGVNDHTDDGGGSAGRRGPGGVAPRSFGSSSSESTPATLLRAQLGSEGGGHDDDDPYDF